MKKAISLILALVLGLSLCACGAPSKCADCEKEVSDLTSTYYGGETYCYKCYNEIPNVSHICDACGKSSYHFTGSTYLCEECYNNVVNAVNKAFGG